MRLSILKNCLGALAALAMLSAASVAAKDKISIGLLEDVSGDIALMGAPKLNGTMLAVEEINKAGGIMGRQVEVTHRV